MSVALRDTPYTREHLESSSRRAERGKMPQTLPGLLRWYCVALAEELPDRTHKGEVWGDRDSIRHHEEHKGRHTKGLGCECEPDRVSGAGGSHLGTLAWNGLFRLMLEGSASATDEDGSYIFPVRATLSRLHRRRPLTVRYLCRVGLSEGDWKSVADSLGYAHEFAEMFTIAALTALWKETAYCVTR